MPWLRSRRSLLRFIVGDEQRRRPAQQHGHDPRAGLRVAQARCPHRPRSARVATQWWLSHLDQRGWPTIFPTTLDGASLLDGRSLARNDAPFVKTRPTPRPPIDLLAVEVTAFLPSLRPAPSRCAAARSARSRETVEHERGGVRRASRDDFAQASPHARTHAGGDVGGRSLCLVRSSAPGRPWIGRDTHARSTQRRRASPLRTPRRACTQRTQEARKRTCLLLRMWDPAAAIAPDAGVAQAAAHDSRGARAVWDMRARVEQRRELRVATGCWSTCFCRLARRACCRLLRVFNAPRRG